MGQRSSVIGTALKWERFSFCRTCKHSNETTTVNSPNIGHILLAGCAIGEGGAIFGNVLNHWLVWVSGLGQNPRPKIIHVCRFRARNQ
jgi:hypothetical protein